MLSNKHAQTARTVKSNRYENDHTTHMTILAMKIAEMSNRSVEIMCSIGLGDEGGWGVVVLDITFFALRRTHTHT